jgi:hypothetical protein
VNVPVAEGVVLNIPPMGFRVPTFARVAFTGVVASGPL